MAMGGNRNFILFIYVLKFFLKNLRRVDEKNEVMMLVCHLLGSFPGEIWNQSRLTEGKESPNKEAATPDGQVAGLINRGTYKQGLSWVAARQSPCTSL